MNKVQEKNDKGSNILKFLYIHIDKELMLKMKALSMDFH